MSRRLWAELGGVALLAIAAVFWMASNQTNVTLQVSPADAGRARTGPHSFCAESRALASTRQLRPQPRTCPRPLLRRQLQLWRPMQYNEPPRQSSRPPRRPQLRPSSRRSPRPRLLRLQPPKPLCRPRPPHERLRRKSRAYMLPRVSLSWSGPGPIQRGIVSDSFSGAAAAGPTGSRWTNSPRPRLSSRRRGSFCLPPSAGSTAHLKWTARSR